MNSIFSELKTNLEYMSAKEKKIAEVILSCPKDFINLNLKELCVKAGVSQGSIINFANKFCGGGFPKLKLLVASSLGANEEFITEKQEDGDLKSILAKTGENYLTAVNNTLNITDENTLKQVANLLLKAKKIQIYGIYRSGIVATDLYYQLLQLNLPASFIVDVLTCAVSASLLDKNSLVVAISSSGQTKDVIDAVKIAKANGVKVVAITGHKNSALANISDYVLVSAPSGNSSLSVPTDARISQLAIVDTLCTYIRRKAGDMNKYFEIENILRTHNVKD